MVYLNNLIPRGGYPESLPIYEINPTVNQAKGALKHFVDKKYAVDTDTGTSSSLNSNRVQLKRQTSMPDLKIIAIMQKEKSLEQLSGEMWICIERKPDQKTPGSLYTFELKEEYRFFSKEPSLDNINAAILKRMEIFPAIERVDLDIAYLNLHTDLNKMVENQLKKSNLSFPSSSIKEQHELEEFCINLHTRDFKYTDSLNQLGYAYHTEHNGEIGSFLTLPDGPALLGRWSLLREHRPYLPELHLTLSDGVATDLQFIENYFTTDILLSTGKEFVHDHTLHAIPTLRLMLDTKEMVGISAATEEESFFILSDNPNDYRSLKIDYIQSMYEDYKRILYIKEMMIKGKIPEDKLKAIQSNLKKFETAIAVKADIFSISNPNLKINRNSVESFFRSKKWSGYFRKRYPGENLNRNTLKAIWDEMGKIAEGFNNPNVVNLK